jgi:hypothetical protein
VHPANEAEIDTLTEIIGQRAPGVQAVLTEGLCQHCQPSMAQEQEHRPSNPIQGDSKGHRVHLLLASRLYLRRDEACPDRCALGPVNTVSADRVVHPRGWMQGAGAQQC